MRSQKPRSKLYKRPRRVYELRWRSSEEWSRSLNRQLGERTVWLKEAEAQVLELQESLEVSRERSAHGLRSDEATLGEAVEVSSAVREVEQARDEALDAIDCSHWELDKMKRDMQQFIRDAVESLRSEFVVMCKQHVGVPRGTEENSRGLGTSLGGGSHKSNDTHFEVQPEHASKSKVSHMPKVGKSLKLPPLPAFNADNREDVDALGRWLAKLEKHAELLWWSEHTKLLQFELHLTGCPERVYELLSLSVKSSFEKASQALHERLYPVESEALVSAQLRDASSSVVRW